MKNEFVSCNGHGIHPIAILRAYYNSFKKFQWKPAGEERAIIYTYQCRNAIALIRDMLNIGPNDEVLVPAYNCGAEIDPYIKSGAKVILYRIDEKLKIDTDDIIKRITPVTKILHITHFFGWPQDIDDLVALCRKKKIFVVEDCAQALFSGGINATIGNKGDAAVYSFVKTLPVPDGGALVIDKKYLKEQMLLQRPEFRNTMRNTIPLLKKWFMNSNKTWQKYKATRAIFCKSWKSNQEKKNETRHPVMLSSNYFDETNLRLSISRVSSGFVSKVNVEKIIGIRRRNYLHLQNNIKEVPGLQRAVRELTDDVCPMSFPVIVQNRKCWYEQLNERGILVQGWPGYYPGFDWDAYPEACTLKDNLITLPVHQYLNSKQMEYIVNNVNEISGSIGSSR